MREKEILQDIFHLSIKFKSFFKHWRATKKIKVQFQTIYFFHDQTKNFKEEEKLIYSRIKNERKNILMNRFEILKRKEIYSYLRKQEIC